MATLVRSTKNDKDIMDLIAETCNINPLECNGYASKDAYIIKSIYPNGLWKKEISIGSRVIIKYSAKIGNKIVYFETVNTILSIESIHNQVMDMFVDYSNGRLWVD